MKRAILAIIALCFVSLNSTAQNIILIKNAWTGAYLNMESGTLQTTAINNDWPSAQWELVKAGNGQFKIKNAAKGTFLNIESGALQCTSVQDDWLSARWAFKNIEGTDLIRICNVWKPTLYINTEKGIECSEIQEGWLSARWKQETVGANISNTNQQESNTGNAMPANFSLNIQEVLDAHNTLRSEMGISPLVWSVELANKAQAWANELAKRNTGTEWHLDHSGPGENLAGGIVSGDSPAKRVLTGWGGEKKNFDPNTRKCIGAWSTCGHYTQVIWKNTTQVGCAIATCGSNGRYILVCNYNPPGNFTNQPAY